MTDILQALILGVVEGVTEFLPVSSTGHMRLVEQFIGEIGSEDFAKSFDIFIQIGAILAVVVYFRHKIAFLFGLSGTDATHRQPSMEPTDPAPDSLVAAPAEPPSATLDYQRRPPAPAMDPRKRTLLLLALATAPLAPFYPLIKKADHFWQDHPSAEPKAIALALGIGGVIMLVIEIFRPRPRTSSMDRITVPQAIAIGVCQVLAAIFPGTSRSAATIMPALTMGIARPAAAEFSFFLAIPAMFAAAGVKLLHFLKSPHHGLHEMILLAIGTLVAFMVAYGVVAAFMGMIRKYTFVPFAIYRILLAILVFALVKG